LDRININKIKDILDKTFINGGDMGGLLCLFNTLFLYIAQNKEEEKEEESGSQKLYKLNELIRNWIKDINKIMVESAQGFVFIADFFSKDIQFILKTPQTIDSFSINEFIQEYFIGLKMNTLRYKIPTFSYTLGGFLCNSLPTDTTDKEVLMTNLCRTDFNYAKVQFILFEKIPGESLSIILLLKLV